MLGFVLLCGAFVATTASAAASYSSVVLADNPVGYWRFGEAPASTTMTDSSPNANNGMYLNGVTLGVPGALSNDPNTASSFDGVNDTARVPDSASLHVGGVFTVEGWIKRSGTARTQELMNKGGKGIQLVVMNAANGNEVWIRKANVTTIARSAVGIPADGKYHHVVATMNGLGPATIYVDGQQGTITVTPNQAIQTTLFPITVGGAGSVQANYDEFAIYPRPLSAAEVLEHYQTGTDIPPTAVNDAATVIEDSGTSPIDVLLNDTDPDGGPKSIASVTQPASGMVVITGGGTGLTYAPSANYCNNPPGTTPSTFTYTLTPGGSTATVSVTVTCVDDPPVAVNDARTVGEDSGAAAVTVLANDTDVDGGPIAISSVMQPVNGTVVITGGGTGLTYQPNAQYCNSGGPPAPDTFTYTLAPGGSSATVSMTVTCVPDAPFVDTSSGALAYTENHPATPIDPGVTVSDADVGGLIASATVQITGNYAGAQDVLALSNAIAHLPITPMFLGDTLTLTGSASPAAYQSALRDVTYVNTSEAPSTMTRTATFTATDTTTLSGSDTRAILVMAVDDPPVAVNDSSTVAEDSGASAVAVLANDSDVDGGTKLVSSVTQPANGTVVITGGGSGLTYAPDANYCNSPPGTTLDTFTYTLNGGSTASVTMTVTCIDDPPVAVDDAKTVVQDSGVNAVDVLANDTDVDGGPKSVGFVTQPGNGSVVISGGGTGVSYTPNAGYCNSGGPPAPDTFTYTLTPGGSSATVSVTVMCLDIAPTAVNDSATVSEDSGANAVTVLANDTDPDGGPKSIASVTQPTNGTVVITGGGTGLTYAPNANYCNSPPGTTPDTFTYTLTPGGSSATVSMTVTCVDDPPVAVNDSATVLEDAAATAVAVLTNDTDIDGGPKSISSVTPPANGTVVITGGGTGLTYAPNANYCNSPPGTTLDTFTYTLTPGGSSAAVSMTVTCVNDAPVATDDTFNATKRAIGNTSLVVNDPTDGAPDPAGPQKTVTGDILSNDSDADGNGSLAVVAATNVPTSDGGTVDIEADGDFTFHPKPGTSCTDHSDSFDYTLTDQNTTLPPGTPGTDTGTVTIEIQDCVWYADSSLGAAGNGTSSTPYNSLANLNGAGGAGDADAAGQRIFLYDGTYSGGLPLESTQTLSGQRNGLAVPDGGAGTVTLEPAGGGDSQIDGGLVLATDNTVQGIHLGSTAGFALSGTSVGNATVDTATSGAINNPAGGGVSINGGALNIALNDTGGVTSGGGTNGIALTGTSGTFTANSGTLSNASGADVSLSGGTTSFTYGGTISDDVGQLVSISNQTGGTKDFNGNITDLANGTGNGISLSSNTGATIRFDGGLTLSTGANPAFSATGGGTLAVTDPAGATNNTIATTTATALNIANTSIDASAGTGGVTFEKVSSNGAGSGIVLNTTGSGPLAVTGNAGTCTSAATCTGGAIQSSTGPGVSLTSVGGGASLAHVLVSGGGDDGIRATTVSGGGMDLSDVRVASNGNSVGERGLDYTNVTNGAGGSSTIASSTITGSAETNARVENNTAGSTSDLDVTGSTFSSNSTALGAHGLEIRPDSTATVNADVTGSTFTANRDNAFQLANLGGSPTMNLHFDTNTVTGGNPSNLSGQPGVVVAPTSGAQTKVEMNANNISGMIGRSVIMNPLSASTASAQFDATVTNNNIGTAAAGSGSSQGEGMMIRPNGDGDARILVSGNTVRHFAQQGIRVLVQDGKAGTANADVTITGNTVSSPDGTAANPSEGILVATGSTSAPTPDNTILCVDVGGAAGLANTFAGSGTGGLPDIAFSKRFSTDIRLPGFSGPFSLAALTTYIGGRNPGNPTVDNYDNALTGTASPCAQPTLPPP